MKSSLFQDTDVLDTHRKALAINLEKRHYGTFAEIGAGQEVARWFFKVGGAAGTIAKTMSAYDMTVSDAIYGKAYRCVSSTRLESMLAHEYQLNLDRLTEQRGDQTCFFSFADTVTARGFRGNGECHGWMGVRFQAHPRDEYSQIIMHVRMLDAENASQQEALGIVGVNLLFGAFLLHHLPERLLESLLDNLTTSRVEVDMIEFSGIEFRHVDNRLMSLQLVQLGLSKAAMFGPSGEVLQPSEVLYKKSILVERGSFRPVCQTNLDMLRCAYETFSKDPEVEGQPVIQLMELTMKNLLTTGEESGKIDYRDFLARTELLSACGMTVLISDYFEYYRLAAYLARYSKQKIGITMGAASLQELFDPKYYLNLEGGILESFGRLFKDHVRLYVYPMQGKAELTTVQNLQVAPELRKLYEYLVDRGCIEQLQNFNPECLPIFSRDILKRIKEGDAAWEKMVPPQVCEMIKRHGYFGFQKEA